MPNSRASIFSATVLAVVLAPNLAAAGMVVPVGNPHDPAVIGAVVRGATDKFVGGIYQSHPSALDDTFNAPGGHAFHWSSTTLYQFEVKYTASTGELTLTIDFPASGNQLETIETSTVVFPQFQNEGFEFVKIAAVGNHSTSTTISNLLINGDSQQSIFADDGRVVRFFGDSTKGTFLDNIDVTGTFSFIGGHGKDDGLPLFRVSLVNVDPPPTPVPEPSALPLFSLLAFATPVLFRSCLKQLRPDRR